jgi:hypothetical protein
MSLDTICNADTVQGLGLGFRVKDLGFRVQGLGVRDKGLRLWV